MKTNLRSFKIAGMITGTISLEDNRLLSSYTLRYIQIESVDYNAKFVDVLNSQKTNFVYNKGQVKFGFSEGDFKEGKKDVYFFNVVEPAGKYKIYELEIFHNSGS